MSFSRRGFLQSASASLGVALLDRSLLHVEDLESTFKEIHANLLEMINEERAVAKVPPHRNFVGAALRGRPFRAYFCDGRHGGPPLQTLPCGFE